MYGDVNAGIDGKVELAYPICCLWVKGVNKEMPKSLRGLELSDLPEITFLGMIPLFVEILGTAFSI